MNLVKMLVYILFINIFNYSLCGNNDLDYIVSLALDHTNSFAVWTFDKSNADGSFSDLKNGINLSVGGKKNNLKKTNDEGIISADFGLGNVILYAKDMTRLNNVFQGSFTVLTIFNTERKKSTFLVGQWEEYDRARTFSIFGNLFDSKVTGQVSKTGNASPPNCDFAWEGDCVGEIVDDNCWHTASIVWNQYDPNAQPDSDSSECVSQNNKRYGGRPSSYECKPSEYNKCSSVDIYLDKAKATKYYKYSKLYLAKKKFKDNNKYLREAYFTVGGGATKHCIQPDSLANDISDTTLLGAPGARAMCDTSTYQNSFIKNQNDFFLRSRYNGKIAAIFVFNKNLRKEEIDYLTFNYCK